MTYNNQHSSCLGERRSIRFLLVHINASSCKAQLHMQPRNVHVEASFNLLLSLLRHSTVFHGKLQYHHIAAHDYSAFAQANAQWASWTQEAPEAFYRSRKLEFLFPSLCCKDSSDFKEQKQKISLFYSKTILNNSMLQYLPPQWQQSCVWDLPLSLLWCSHSYRSCAFL